MLTVLLRRYVTGILPRYVLGQVLKAFVLAMTAITGVFVLIMVMAQAQSNGLTPRDVLRLIPFLIPSTLPYTLPVAMLFAVSVVYGRLAGDNEVIAVKTAGLGAMTVLAPSMASGLVLSLGMLYATAFPIPQATHFVKVMIFSNFEEMFFKWLKKDREIRNPNLPFYISVKDVDGRTLIGAIFIHRRSGSKDADYYDAYIYADRATIRFDRKAGLAHVFLEGALFQGGSNLALIHNEQFDIPFPGNKEMEAANQELTTPQLSERKAHQLALIQTERRKQAEGAALTIASGRFDRIAWPALQSAYSEFDYWMMKYHAAETEKQMRFAMAFGCFFFVLLGAPVGILFAKRDFLSAFLSCFVPIILLYYPLTLLGMNLSKEGQIDPTVSMWSGNVLLAVLAWFFALPPVRNH